MEGVSRNKVVSTHAPAKQVMLETWERAYFLVSVRPLSRCTGHGHVRRRQNQSCMGHETCFEMSSECLGHGTCCEDLGQCVGPRNMFAGGIQHAGC